MKKGNTLYIIIALAFLSNIILSYYQTTYSMEQQKIAQEEQYKKEKEEEKNKAVYKYRISIEMQDFTYYNEDTSIKTMNGYCNTYEVNVIDTYANGKRYILEHPINKDYYILCEFDDNKSLKITEVDSDKEFIKIIGTFSYGNIVICDEQYSNAITN